MTQRRKTDNATATRARIILMTCDGFTADEVAAALSVSRRSVYKWVWRFDEEGIEGLRERERTGRPRILDLDDVMEILRMTIEEVPPGATHWSLTLMANAAGVTRHQVREVWMAAGLKPHRVKSFKISRDPKFADKVVDVVGLYMNPPTNALVLSVDEKTQIQALDRTQPMLQLRPGQVERRTHDYKRHGTVSLYAAMDLATGQVIDRISAKHRAADFLEFLALIDRRTLCAPTVHLILDNSSTHKTPEVLAWLRERPRFQLHFTPTSASWLNAVESWFSVLERRAVRRGVFTSVSGLKTALRDYVAAHNKHFAKPFTWTKSAESILAAVDRARREAHL
ncbi:MAG: IS630 family transposase [Deltaproteobacteria bacterium]|nr:IS630 family transposase [Deltaproteobacteria bacterium]